MCNLTHAIRNGFDNQIAVINRAIHALQLVLSANQWASVLDSVFGDLRADYITAAERLNTARQLDDRQRALWHTKATILESANKSAKQKQSAVNAWNAARQKLSDFNRKIEQQDSFERVCMSDVATLRAIMTEVERLFSTQTKAAIKFCDLAATARQQDQSDQSARLEAYISKASPVKGVFAEPEDPIKPKGESQAKPRAKLKTAKKKPAVGTVVPKRVPRKLIAR